LQVYQVQKQDCLAEAQFREAKGDKTLFQRIISKSDWDKSIALKWQKPRKSLLI
jgi:hypothetical protein